MGKFSTVGVSTCWNNDPINDRIKNSEKLRKKKLLYLVSISFLKIISFQNHHIEYTDPHQGKWKLFHNMWCILSKTTAFSNEEDWQTAWTFRKRIVWKDQVSEFCCDTVAEWVRASVWKTDCYQVGGSKPVTVIIAGVTLSFENHWSIVRVVWLL